MTRRLPALKPREVIRALQRAGFFVDHVTGSHHILHHPQKPHLRITVAITARTSSHRPSGRSFGKRALTNEEFLDLL